MLAKNNKDTENKDRSKGSYSVSDIIEKSSKLSGDWLEKQVRKDWAKPQKEKDRNKK